MNTVFADAVHRIAGIHMVDCMSMVILRNRDITEVLTKHDHFAQEGFAVLLRDDAD